MWFARVRLSGWQDSGLRDPDCLYNGEKQTTLDRVENSRSARASTHCLEVGGNVCHYTVCDHFAVCACVPRWAKNALPSASFLRYIVGRGRTRPRPEVIPKEWLTTGLISTFPGYYATHLFQSRMLSPISINPPPIFHLLTSQRRNQLVRMTLSHQHRRGLKFI